MLLSLSSASYSLSFNNHMLLYLKSFLLGQTHDSFPSDFFLFISLWAAPNRIETIHLEFSQKLEWSRRFFFFCNMQVLFSFTCPRGVSCNRMTHLFPDWIEIESLDFSLRNSTYTVVVSRFAPALQKLAFWLTFQHAGRSSTYV